MNRNVVLVGLILTLALILSAANAQQDTGFALLDVKGANFRQDKICANFQQFPTRSLPRSASDAKAYKLGFWNDELSKLDVCTTNSADLRGKIVPLNYVSQTPADTGTCHVKPNGTYIEEQVNQLKSANASAALFLLDKGTPSQFHVRNFLFARFYNPKVANDTPTFYMYQQQFEDLYAQLGADSSATFQFYRPADPFLDAGVFVVLALAVGCILAGCIWYSHELRRRIDIGELKPDLNGQLTEVTATAMEEATSSARSDTPNTACSENREPETVCCCSATGPCMHLVYAIQAFTLVALILVLSFFYRPIAVEFFNVFIIIGGALTMQQCAIALLRNCIPDPKWRSMASWFGHGEETLHDRACVPSFVYRPFRPIAFILLIVAFAFSITWRINIDQWYAYLMLDVMNIAICVYSVKASELRSLRLITFFLVAMFVYDIVMVFGTRLITETGCSVMVQVVTGMDCTKTRKIDYSSDFPVAPVVSGLSRPQKIPLLFYVPLLSNPVGHCFDSAIEGEYQNMMLGLGDVIAPGYLIAFAFYLDVRKSNRFHLYGLTALTGYALGMISTFISLKLMNTAQPALIYLVPFTLLPLTLLCLYKGTLREAWKGNIRSVN